MRGDISDAILQKTSLKNQGIANNANPKISLVISRKQTILDDFSFVNRRRARRTTLNAVSDIGVAVCHPKLNGENTTIWIPYINAGKLYVRWSEDTVDLSDMQWKSIPLNQPSCTKCDAGFASRPVENDRGEIEYVTDKYPFIFYLNDGEVRYIRIISVQGEYQIFDSQLIASGVSDISARQTPAGLGLFYLKNGAPYYILYNSTSRTWGSEQIIGVIIPGVTITELSSFDITSGVGLQAYGNDRKLYQLIGNYTTSFSWGIWTEVCEADGTGFIVEFYDGNREAFFNHDSFKYSLANALWVYGEENDLHSYSYAVVQGDHTNKGTVYLANLMHGTSNDIIYCIKYTYMRDVSGYVKNATHVLQADNPITQINVIMKNIKDSLYTSDATLFAPSSMMLLGISYGDSEIINMATGYIDEVNFKHGEDTVSISGRNKTGVLLADQTFDEDFAYNDTPTNVIKDIMKRFDITDYAVDPNGDLQNGQIVNVALAVESSDSGLKVLQSINDMLSNGVTVGQQWKFEENYDGKIVIGYDDFRSQYIPKGNYVFDGRSDVFAENVDRCTDGVYTQVRCTGTTPGGKYLSYTYSVKNFRFWRVGKHRTYHAKRIDGITKSALKTYAKALAKQLKYAGRIITYKMNLKPQLQIGDVAKVTYDIDEGDVPEQLGFITEINHNLGVDGYFTEFIITSGGDINEIPNTSKVYSADKAVNGTNRKKRLTDYFGKSNTGESNSGYASIENKEALNFVETVRNMNFRFLDEPSDISVMYADTVPAINIKWSDPLDIETNEPVPAQWAGTVVVRSEAGAPIHRWDNCTLITDSTTRDAYKSNALTDNTVEYDHKYYYGIFPYDTEGHYRFTKVIYVECVPPVDLPEIISLSCSIVNVTVVYEISDNYTWDYVVLVYKKGSAPTSKTDGTVINIINTRSQVLLDMDEESIYYFKIYSQEHVSGKEFESDAESIKTGKKPVIEGIFRESICVARGGTESDFIEEVSVTPTT